MAQKPLSSRLIDPVLFGTWVAENRQIWQMNFLNPNELATFCQRRGLSSFDKKVIIQLWQYGLLQADLIESDRELQHEGLVKHGMNTNGQLIYSDQRQLLQRAERWDDVITGTQPLLSKVTLLFHPFRYYVLHKIGWTQFPISLTRPDFISLNQYYNLEIFAQEIEAWNDSASLIILAEPCAYRRIFHSYIVHSPYRGNTGLEQLIDHIHIHYLDPNEDIHTLVCLGKSELRLKLEGRLGGAIFFRTMAEFLRRTTQEVFREELPEEDEWGYGRMPIDAKKQSYGSNRLLEGNRKVANEFLRQFGLDYSLRLRWYVEGATEFYALRYHFDKVGANDIEVIDLHGQVYQKNPKGLAFRGSLRSDIAMQLFSFVSIDEGEERNEKENIRVVKQAVANQDMCGAFSEPISVAPILVESILVEPISSMPSLKRPTLVEPISKEPTSAERTYGELTSAVLTLAEQTSLERRLLGQTFQEQSW